MHVLIQDHSGWRGLDVGSCSNASDKWSRSFTLRVHPLNWTWPDEQCSLPMMATPGWLDVAPLYLYTWVR